MTTPQRPKVKLAGKLPPADRNGLLAASADLLDDPGRLRVAVVVLAAVSSEESFQDQTLTVKTEIRRIEVIEGEDLATAKKLILRAADAREGKTVLPFQTEADIDAIFASFIADGIPDDDGDDGGDGDGGDGD
jgi:hypothetical protein